MLAASWGHPSSVNALIRVGNASINLKDEGGDTALHEAARANELETLSQLISLGADKDARNKLGATPLLLASHAGHKRIVVALLDAGRGGDGEEVAHARRVLAAARRRRERKHGVSPGSHRRRRVAAAQRVRQRVGPRYSWRRQ